MRNAVTAIKKKYDGTPKKTWPGDLAHADDAWMVAFYERPGEQTEAGQEVVYALQYFAVERPLSVLVYFDALGRVMEYQCDACLPAEVRGREIAWVDLDLNVMAGPELAPRVRDFDDFARNSQRMGYSDTALAAAEEGVNLALRLMLQRATPFDGSAEDLLGRVLAAQGPV